VCTRAVRCDLAADSQRSVRWTQPTSAHVRSCACRRRLWLVVSVQVTLLKQEKVPCLSDNEARLALDPKDKFQILTKPHGHGDVHFLLHSTGTLAKWKASGMRWVYFLQDTNALAFKVLPATLGVSSKLGLQVNSVCVPRTAGESIGGLMRLTHKSGAAMTANVEYNQIDALLKATVDPKGDVAGPDGYSPYPGSINQLLFALAPFESTLRKTGGTMPEFVNPKYTDGTKTAFKAPTRLECMMQDYPKSLDAAAKVGYTIVTGTTSFSPVKTNLKDAVVKSKEGMPTYSAASGEADAYASAGEMLTAAGVSMPPAVAATMAGVAIKLGVRAVIDPSFGVDVAAWKAKLPSPSKIKMTARSTLLLQGDLSGTCAVDRPPPTTATAPPMSIHPLMRLESDGRRCGWMPLRRPRDRGARPRWHPGRQGGAGRDGDAQACDRLERGVELLAAGP
jgi:UDP-sugar pyrophosphorylase